MRKRLPFSAEESPSLPAGRSRVPGVAAAHSERSRGPGLLEPGSRMASTRETSFPGRGVFDLRAVSLDEPQMEGLRHLASPRRPARAAPEAGRFLKQGERGVGAGHGRGPQLSWGRPSTTAPPGNTAVAPGSQIRTSAVLRKVAQMETKILGRAKAHRPQGGTESGPKTMRKDPPRTAEHGACRSAASPPPFQAAALKSSEAESPAPGRAGSRFLKTRGPAAQAKAPPASWRSEPAGRRSCLDGEAEDVEAWMGGLADSPRAETRSPRGLASEALGHRGPGSATADQMQTQRIYPGARPSGTRSPPASGPAHGAFPGACSQAGVAGDPASRTAPLSVSESSRAGHGHLASHCRSVAGSSEEVASDTGNHEDNDSLDDFRLNILSLDDLASAVSENSGLGQKGASAAGRESPERNLAAQAPASALLEAPQRPQPRSSAFQGAASSGAGVPTERESEVSEHLGGSMCSSRPRSSALESSSRDLKPTPGSSEAASEGAQDAVSPSTEAALPSRPPSSRRWQARPVARVTLRETAVQTLDMASANLWTEAAGVALGGAYVDPAPIAPHVVSAEAIEALTAHRPAAVALDDLLRQQLHLTQQFVQASRHLHASLLRSLDGDAFHYHSLEEAKEYIRRHKPGH